MLLQYVEVAKVFDLLCHPVSSIELRAQASSLYSKAKRHRGICESKKSLTILGSTTEANEREKPGGTG